MLPQFPFEEQVDFDEQFAFDPHCAFWSCEQVEQVFPLFGCELAQPASRPVRAAAAKMAVEFVFIRPINHSRGSKTIGFAERTFSTPARSKVSRKKKLFALARRIDDQLAPMRSRELARVIAHFAHALIVVSRIVME